MIAAVHLLKVNLGFLIFFVNLFFAVLDFYATQYMQINTV